MASISGASRDHEPRRPHPTRLPLTLGVYPSPRLGLSEQGSQYARHVAIHPSCADKHHPCPGAVILEIPEPHAPRLGHGHDFQQVAVRLLEVEATPASAGVDLAVGGAVWPAAVGEPLACTRPKIASNSASLTWKAW